MLVPILILGFVIATALAFLKAYGLIIVLDLMSIATMKSVLEPDDDSPGLLHVLVPSVVFLACGISLHLATDLLIWLLNLVPSALLAIPVIKHFCRMTWRNATLTSIVTLLVHIVALLTLNYFGFTVEFEPYRDSDGVW